MDPNILNSLAAFLKTSSGLTLSADKAYLVYSRLQPLTTPHGCGTVEDLIRKLASSPTQALKQDIVEAMTTNETSFFRDATPFDTFKNHVLPNLIERRATGKAIRILCMASSSGQEPYSLAMILAENNFRLQGWRTDIVAVDIDTKVLKRAEEGVYSQFETQRGLPIQMLVKYFDRNAEGNFAVKPVIKKYVKFQRCNMLEPFGHLGQFDIVFCRNVLIYFDKATKRGVLDRLSQQIPDDGYLFLGGAETVIDVTERFVNSPGQRGLYVPQRAKNATTADRGALKVAGVRV